MKGLLRCDARTDLFLPLEGLQNEPRNPLGLTRMGVYGDNVGGGRSMDHQRALLAPRARAGRQDRALLDVVLRPQCSWVYPLGAADPGLATLIREIPPSQRVKTPVLVLVGDVLLVGAGNMHP